MIRYVIILYATPRRIIFGLRIEREIERESERERRARKNKTHRNASTKAAQNFGRSSVPLSLRLSSFFLFFFYFVVWRMENNASRGGCVCVSVYYYYTFACGTNGVRPPLFNRAPPGYYTSLGRLFITRRIYPEHISYTYYKVANSLPSHTHTLFALRLALSLSLSPSPVCTLPPPSLSRAEERKGARRTRLLTKDDTTQTTRSGSGCCGELSTNVLSELATYTYTHTYTHTRRRGRRRRRPMKESAAGGKKKKNYK